MKYCILLQCFVLFKLCVAQVAQQEQMLQAPQQFQSAEGFQPDQMLQAPQQFLQAVGFQDDQMLQAPRPEDHLEDEMESIVGKKHVFVPLPMHHGHDDHGHGHGHGYGHGYGHGHEEKKEVTFNVNLFKHKAKKDKKDKKKEEVHHNNYYSYPHYSYPSYSFPKYEHNVYKKVEHGGYGKGYGQEGGYGGGHGYGHGGGYGKGYGGGHGGYELVSHDSGYGKGYGHGGGHGGGYGGGYGKGYGHEGGHGGGHGGGYGKGYGHEGGHGGYGHGGYGGGHEVGHGYGHGGGHDRYYRSPETCSDLAVDVASQFAPVLTPVYDDESDLFSRVERSDTETAATETTQTQQTEGKVRQNLLTTVVGTAKVRTYRSPETGEWVAFLEQNVKPEETVENPRAERSVDVEVVPVVYTVYQDAEDFFPDPPAVREARRVDDVDDQEVDESARVLRAVDVEVVPQALFVTVGEDGRLYNANDERGSRLARFADYSADELEELVNQSGEQETTCEGCESFERTARFADNEEDTEGYTCQVFEDNAKDENVEPEQRFARSTDDVDETAGCYACQALQYANEETNWDQTSFRFARSTAEEWYNVDEAEPTDTTCRVLRSTDDSEFWDVEADTTCQLFDGLETSDTTCRVVRSADNNDDDAEQLWYNDENEDAETAQRFVRSTDDSDYVRSYRSTGCYLLDDPTVHVFVPTEETNEETLARFGRDVELFTPATEETDDQERFTRSTDAETTCAESELESVTTDLGETYRRCRSLSETVVEPVVREVMYEEVDTDELVELVA